MNTSISAYFVLLILKSCVSHDFKQLNFSILQFDTKLIIFVILDKMLYLIINPLIG